MPKTAQQQPKKSSAKGQKLLDEGEGQDDAHPDVS